MLALTFWSGMLPRQKESQLKVYSKLGGVFLGVLDRPCLDYAGQAYQVLRDMQDQIATMLRHYNRPPRYLVLMANNVCLTRPDFMFVQQLDLKESRHVFATLGKAFRLDVFYNEDDSEAKRYLERKEMRVVLEGNILEIDTFELSSDMHCELLSSQLEVFTFQAEIQRIETYTYARKLGCIDLFPHVKVLWVNGYVKEIDFTNLAQSMMLVELRVTLKTKLDKSIAAMTNLKELCVYQRVLSTIPTEIGLMTNLTTLEFCNHFEQCIPTQVGKLKLLTSLSIRGTKLTGCIPSELCNLTCLALLDLCDNPYLEGCLPSFQALWSLDLAGTHDVVAPCMDGWLETSTRVWHRDGLGGLGGLGV
jgi:hypothetical protein